VTGAPREACEGGGGGRGTTSEGDVLQSIVQVKEDRQAAETALADVRR
jgi:hypothetical protein